MQGKILEVGGEITTKEHLQLLPIGAILRVIDAKYKTTGVVLKRDRGCLKTFEGDFFAHNYESVKNFFQKYQDITLVYLPPPPRIWQVGDRLSTLGEFETLPEGTVVVENPGVWTDQQQVFAYEKREFHLLGTTLSIGLLEMQEFHSSLKIIYIPEVGNND